MSEMADRPYQERAIRNVEKAWQQRARTVCLVAPTGSGKTHMGDRLVAARKTLWVAHRRELVHQAAGKLRKTRGVSGVGIVMPGEFEVPYASVQVGTIQTLLARQQSFDVDLVVLDEAHHYVAEEWRALVEAYPKAKFLGLTATPERQDGEPLGDIFRKLIVAADYSELLKDGFLVPCTVYQPPKNLGNDLALDPVDAWARYSEGSQAFVFSALVDTAYDVAKRFRANGVIAQTIEANTSQRDRENHLTGFRNGRVRALTNVYTMTEGVDVPEARTAILARAFRHVGNYLQCVGRVLRSAPGKTSAIIIDLCGATHRHGLPTQDREYSLTGEPISTGGGEGSGGGGGPIQQTVKGLDLQIASAVKLKAPKRVKLKPVDEKARKAEYRRLLKLARKHNMRDGFAAVKYREKYGEEPRREWA